MSHSYKHNPAFRTNNQFNKRYANKIVRKSKLIANNKFYKKIFSSYNISGYSSFYPFYLYKREYLSSLKGNEDSWLRILTVNEYFKYYYRK